MYRSEQEAGFFFGRPDGSGGNGRPDIAAFCISAFTVVGFSVDGSVFVVVEGDVEGVVEDDVKGVGASVRDDGVAVLVDVETVDRFSDDVVDESADELESEVSSVVESAVEEDWSDDGLLVPEEVVGVVG